MACTVSLVSHNNPMREALLQSLPREKTFLSFTADLLFVAKLQKSFTEFLHYASCFPHSEPCIINLLWYIGHI